MSLDVAEAFVVWATEVRFEGGREDTGEEITGSPNKRSEGNKAPAYYFRQSSSEAPLSLSLRLQLRILF